MADRMSGQDGLILAMTGAALLAGMAIGVTPLPAALVIAVSGALTLSVVFARAPLPKPARWTLALVGYCGLSGFLFGGFESISETTFRDWIANEGRVFLAFWPGLFLLAVHQVPAAAVERGCIRIFRAATLLYLLSIALWILAGIATFSTHHAAGAFGSALLIFHVMRYDLWRKWPDLAFALLSAFALLGSNSRTALLAVAISILAVLALHGRVLLLLRAGAVGVALLSIMPLAYPYQFARLAGTGTGGALAGLQQSFAFAMSQRAQFEVAKAWDLSERLDLGENANLAIRGYLWGKALREGLRSPVLGVGFGRGNDIGREFSGWRYLLYPATFARLPSARDQTAHNTYLQHFSELGALGLWMIAGLFRAYLRRFRERSGARREAFWRRTGLASLLTLALMGITQHSLGAPIYGLSLLLVAALAYGQGAALPRRVAE